METITDNLALFIGLALLAVFALITLIRAFFTVDQGTVAVITRFGKYHKVGYPGLNMKNPWIDSVYTEESTQSRAYEIKFQAITADQANVHFSAMLIYAIIDGTPETIIKAAFKFSTTEEWALALTKTIEGSVRAFIATKRQPEILTLRQEIVSHVKGHLDETLETWGYHLLDLQMNDIAFDAEITESMARVVASSNLRAAAENEGAALLIQQTKKAEAEGNYIKIQAQAEKEAAELRGEGVAAFRRAVAAGIGDSAEELKKQGVGTDVIMFSMWTEAVKNFAEAGKGNVIFLDGSPAGMEQIQRQIMAMGKLPLGERLKDLARLES